MKSIDERIKNLPPALKKELEKFVNDLLKKRSERKFRRAGAPKEHRGPDKELEVAVSEAEHARIIGVLDRVSALSVESGPPVSNRDHDRYLYGGP
jgi:hypothetical protein